MAHRLSPLFLPSEAGRIHMTEWLPDAPAPGAPMVIAFPPFAEELNRSRRQLACQARELAARGIGMVIFDAFGTGDSEGDFADARWDLWRADARAVVEYVCARQPSRLGALAVRNGALLAADTFASAAGRFACAVFWAPVTEGRAVVRQLLRLHAAAFMSAQQGDTVARSAEQQLAAGRSIEIAGYTVSSGLVRDLEALRLKERLGRDSPPIEWIDLVASADQGATPASVRVTRELTASGVNVQLSAMVDEPFWSLPEITVATQLSARTTALLAAGLEHHG